MKVGDLVTLRWGAPMKYLPWIAGRAALGLAARGRRALYTPAQARERAGWAEGEVSEAMVEDFAWRYDPHFPLSRVRTMDTTKPWDRRSAVEWLEDERKWDRLDGTRRWTALAAWWLPDPTKEPIVVSVDSHGLAELWDGHHRFAIAAEQGWTTIPAFVGENILAKSGRL